MFLHYLLSPPHIHAYTSRCNSSSSSSSLSFSDQTLNLRANLLLNQYAAAMLVALGQQPGGRGGPGRRGVQATGGIPLPETQQLVNHLVLDPLSSPRGYGSMILVRYASQASLKLSQGIKSLKTYG